MEFPESVLLREDGPREGFQMHPDVVPTKKKLELIAALSKTGIRSIEVTSFVRPDRVPQHADAEDVCKGLTEVPGLRYRALYLNEKGLDRALAQPNIKPEGYLLFAASEPFLKKNNNQTLDEAVSAIDSWFEAFLAHGIHLERVMMSTAFGDADSGLLPATATLNVCERVIDRVAERGGEVPEITFADTTGFANPQSVESLVKGCQDRWPEIEIGLHLHDTRGTGMANVLAGLLCGVSRFDTSVGGLGGCPFTKSTAGNVPTEDVAFLCEQLGIRTGLDLKAYIAAAKLAEQIVGRKLPGKLKDAGLLPNLKQRLDAKKRDESES